MGFRVLEPAPGSQPQGEDKPRRFRAIEPAPQTRGKGKRTFWDDATGVMAQFNRGLAVGDELAAGAKTAGSILAGRSSLSDAPKTYRNALGEQRALEDDAMQNNRLAANLARGTGMAATAAVPTGGTANLLANSSRAANMGRGAVTAGLTGAAYSAADSGTGEERLRAASRAALDPLVLGLGAAGGALAPAASRARKQRVSPDVELLHKEGVPITWGQQGGRVSRATEDAATSIPIGGDAIAKAQTRGQEGFNRAVLNRALKPIGKTLPDDVPIGTDAIKHTGDALSAAYKKVLPEGRVQLDPQFGRDIQRSVGTIAETLTEAGQNRLQSIMQTRLRDRFAADQGVVSGQRFKQIESELDYEINRFSASLDPDDRAVSEGLKAVKDALVGAAQRQNPKFAEAKTKIDQGWATLVQAETAAAKAGAEGGVFTPKMFAAAVRGGDNRVRRRGYARGEALNQDLAGAGERVLSSRVPDSGTGRRTAQMALAGGGGAAAFANPLSMIPSAAMIGGTAAAYSGRGQQIAQQVLSRRLSRQGQETALAELRALASQSPEAARLYREVMSRLPRAAGVAGAAGEQ